MTAELAAPAAEDVSCTVPVGMVDPDTIACACIDHIDSGMRASPEAVIVAAERCDAYLTDSAASGSTPLATDCNILTASAATRIGPCKEVSTSVDWLPSLPLEASEPTAYAQTSEAPDFTFTAGDSGHAEAGGQERRGTLSCSLLASDTSSAVVPSADCCSCDNGLDACWQTPGVDLLQKDVPAGCERASHVAGTAKGGMNDISVVLTGSGQGTQCASTGVWLRIPSADSVAWTKSDQDASCEGLSQQTWPDSSRDDTPASSAANLLLRLPQCSSDAASNHETVCGVHHSCPKGGETVVSDPVHFSTDSHKQDAGLLESSSLLEMHTRSWEANSVSSECMPGFRAPASPADAYSGHAWQSADSCNSAADVPDFAVSSTQGFCVPENQSESQPSHLLSLLEKDADTRVRGLRYSERRTSQGSSSSELLKTTMPIRPRRTQPGMPSVRSLFGMHEQQQHELAVPPQEQDEETIDHVHEPEPSSSWRLKQSTLFLATPLQTLARWLCMASGKRSCGKEAEGSTPPKVNGQFFSLTSDRMLSINTATAIRERQNRCQGLRKSRSSAAFGSQRSTRSSKAQPSEEPQQRASGGGAATKLVGQAQQLLESPQQEDHDDAVMRAFTLLTEGRFRCSA